MCVCVCVCVCVQRLEDCQRELHQALENEKIVMEEMSKLRNKNAQMSHVSILLLLAPPLPLLTLFFFLLLSQLKLLVSSLEQQVAENKTISNELACKLGRAEEEVQLVKHL